MCVCVDVPDEPKPHVLLFLAAPGLPSEGLRQYSGAVPRNTVSRCELAVPWMRRESFCMARDRSEASEIV